MDGQADDKNHKVGLRDRRDIDLRRMLEWPIWGLSLDVSPTERYHHVERGKREGCKRGYAYNRSVAAWRREPPDPSGRRTYGGCYPAVQVARVCEGRKPIGARRCERNIPIRHFIGVGGHHLRWGLALKSVHPVNSK